MTVRLPVHRVLHLTGTDIVVAAIGRKFLAVNSKNGQILAAPASVLSQIDAAGAQAIADEEFPDATISLFALHPETSQLAVSADNKQVACYDVRTWTRLSSRISIKRASCLSFSKDGGKLLIGDKFGDVYSFKSNDTSDKEALILGHVSLLTSMTLTQDGKYLLTGDRDEKIRVSRYPLAFEIEQFCLGHKLFVSSLHIPAFAPDVLLSGGGDPFLLTWDFMAGKILQQIPLQEADEPVAVSAIVSHPQTKVVAVVLEKSKNVLMFNASNARDLQLLQKITLPTDALSVTFTDEGHLLIALAPRAEGPLVELARYSAGSFTLSQGDALTQQLNAIPTSSDEEMPDFYPTSKLRKTEVVPNRQQKRKENEGGAKGKNKRAKNGKTETAA
ncbi:WD40-repeat-containing domain protein [Powellomyces hirtus]|nr:WD40-repeat-containing domain protein [Powellomyces hirtus]